MSNTLKWIIAIVVIVLVLGGLWWWQTGGSMESETGPVVIGYIGPLSGPSAVLGMDAIKALEIARDEINANGGINGREVVIIAEDDQYLTEKTVSAYNKLVNSDGAKIILAANYGGVFAIKERAKDDDVLIIDPLDCNSEVADASSNVFCLATETESIGTSLAEYLNNQGTTKVGVMYSTKDSFMALVNRSFDEVFSGETIEQDYLYTDSDFRTSLLKIKEFGAEALVILGHDEQGVIMRQARELGLNVPFLTTGTITSPGAQEASGNGAEGTVFAYWEGSKDNEGANEFDAKFTELVGRGPILPLTTHPAYDTLMVLAEEVLPDVSSTSDVDQLKKELLKVQGYKGITGIVSFDKDGAAKIPESVYRLVGGVPVKI